MVGLCRITIKFSERSHTYTVTLPPRHSSTFEPLSADTHSHTESYADVFFAGGKFSLTKMQVVSLFRDSEVEVLAAMVANMVYIIDALARNTYFHCRLCLWDYENFLLGTWLKPPPPSPPRPIPARFRQKEKLSVYITKYLYMQSTTVYVPSSELELPQPISRKRVCPPKGGGHTRLRLRGWGSSNSDDWRKSLELCLLCGLHGTQVEEKEKDRGTIDRQSDCAYCRGGGRGWSQFGRLPWPRFSFKPLALDSPCVQGIFCEYILKILAELDIFLPFF